MMALLLGLVLGLAACGGGGGGGGGAGQGGESPPPQPLSVALPGEFVVKLRSRPGEGWSALMELPRLWEVERRLLVASAGGRGTPRAYAAPTGWSLLDFAQHPSGELSLLLGTDHRLRLLRLDREGRPLREQDFLDPLTPADPTVGDFAIREPRDSLLPYGTRDAARLAAIGEDLALALRPVQQTVVLHRLAYSAAAGFEKRWRSLVEPGVFIGVRGLRNGSFDPFRALDHQWRLLLDADAQGRIAVAVSVMDTELIAGHAQHFGEPLDPAVLYGALLSQFDGAGRRLGTVLVDTRLRSEPHVLRWVGERVALAGRVRSRQVAEGWDGYLALVPAGAPSAAAPPLYRVLDVEQGDVILDMAGLPDGRLLVAGSTAYTQNPQGASISEEAQPLLALLGADGQLQQRLAPRSGPRHNQLRALAPWAGGAWLAGGMENGPGTHSADGNPALLSADGLVREFRSAP